MHPAIQDKLKALPGLCAKHRVKRLELFGSATTERFDPARSDVDFLVEYLAIEDGQHANAYFGLLEDLEALFGRKVDLAMTGAVTNPYFLRGIASSRTTVYAA
jgi:predicted nucleotidyltransferase